MSEDRIDQPEVAIHPPTIFLSALLIGFIIRVFAGGWMPVPRIPAEAVGGVLLLGALFAAVSSISAFAETGETLRPASPSKALLTDGAYQFSRNPIYLAMVLFGIGLGVATLNLWMVLTTIAAGLIFNFFVIPQEEAYLERKFGVDYREYCERVRRWV
ncbi:MAG: isoprenylcysteine carboxylmethyltransferase family protein [Pseudomonadota bacterium]